MRHHIQRSILDNLAISEIKRYSEIKPSDLDGNVFGYHLKALISEGYVNKTTNGDYSLTSRGKDFVVRRYEDPLTSARSIYLIVVRSGNDYLLRTRKIQPLIGYTGFIHGEPEPKLSVAESAEKRLLDKSGLKINLSVKGNALISQYLNSDLQSYSQAIILYGEIDKTDSIKKEDETGINSWSKLKSASNLLPSCFDIVNMIDSKTRWLEKKYQL